MPAPLPDVIDPAQLVRIEAVHRGFLYQHLYAVGCLLVAPTAAVQEIRVERDEDIEVRSSDHHYNIQVKTRKDLLQPADVADVLERFAEIREARKSQTSPEQRFLVVSNVAPGPKLARELKKKTWPADVTIIWPGYEGELPVGIPPAPADLAAAVESCTALAAGIPYTRVAPATLTWKLAALVQAACAGEVGTAFAAHAFRVSNLAALFEQVVVELQALPEPPVPYFSHDDEPMWASDRPVRIIAAPTGAGKTAWASINATHASRTHAYFAASLTNESSFPAALARDLTARFVASEGGDVGSILLPGNSGLESLRALSIHLAVRKESVTVIVDDVQRLRSDDILATVEAAPTLNWILLGHRGDTVDYLTARLMIETEELRGWELETIATALRHYGCPADAPTCERVRLLTGALPLFVMNIGHLAVAKHAGSVSRCCGHIEQGLHVNRTAQEVLLADALASLSPTARNVADVIGIARVPLNAKELQGICAELPLPEARVLAAIRELVARGVVREVARDHIQLHDSFRLLCNGTTGALSVEQEERVKKQLAETLAPGAKNASLERGARYLELLPEVGKTSLLVEIASNEAERLYELGLTEVARKTLERVLNDDAHLGEDRFWAGDALIYWSFQRRDLVAAAKYIHQAESLRPNEISSRAGATFVLKQMLYAGYTGDTDAARDAYEKLRAAETADPMIDRIVRYNYACILLHAGEIRQAGKHAESLMEEYYGELGWDPMQIVGRNPNDLAKMLPKGNRALDDVKRLADTLDLYARISSAMGRHSGLARIHALKFYTLAHSYKSAIRCGQDVVDELAEMDDYTGAREFMENTLLPTVTELGLMAHMVPVRAQYAVILAYCGEVDLARAEMQRLKLFAPGNSIYEDELNGQADMIESIAAHLSAMKNTATPKRLTAGVKKVGRNSTCPCGSNLKYKHCCGSSHA